MALLTVLGDVYFSRDVWVWPTMDISTEWSDLTLPGFAGVVTSTKGDLWAWGNGVPPRWVKASADAERWALASPSSPCAHFFFVKNLDNICENASFW